MPFAFLWGGRGKSRRSMKMLTVDIVIWDKKLECSRGKSAKAILRDSQRSVRESDCRQGKGETRARSG